MEEHHKFRNCVLICAGVFVGYAGILAVATAFKIGKNKGKSKPSRKSRFDAWQSEDCQPIPKHVYRRPDPLIYSQQYLISQGLAVTWSNPDVHLELGGVPIDSSDLKPSTTYDVIARIWNGAIDAPIAGLPVHVSYLSFGIGTQEHLIAVTAVDLGAKAAPGCPAFAHVQWTTPPTPGHYCLLVRLVWADDANPFNNLGQHNTQVKPLNSPRAVFDFSAANPRREVLQVHLTVDSYFLPDLPPCTDNTPATGGPPDRSALGTRRRAVIAKNSSTGFPVPPGWTVNVNPASFNLGPGEQKPVKVEVIAPDGFTGRRSFNVNGFSGTELLGGVTLIVTG